MGFGFFSFCRFFVFLHAFYYTNINPSLHLISLVSPVLMPFSIQHPHHLRTSPAQPVTASPATVAATRLQPTRGDRTDAWCVACSAPSTAVIMAHSIAIVGVPLDAAPPTAHRVAGTLLLLLGLLPSHTLRTPAAAVRAALTLGMVPGAPATALCMVGTLLLLLRDCPCTRQAVRMIPTTV